MISFFPADNNVRLDRSLQVVLMIKLCYRYFSLVSRHESFDTNMAAKSEKASFRLSDFHPIQLSNSLPLLASRLFSTGDPRSYLRAPQPLNRTADPSDVYNEGECLVPCIAVARHGLLASRSQR